MKTLITAAIIGTAIVTGCTKKLSESEIPEVVIESFNVNFKDVKADNWEKERDGSYEAEFDLNNIETSATFSADGKLLETEQEIEKEDLPQAVIEYLKTNYTDKNIDEAAKITTGEGIVKFEVEIENKDLIFDDKGLLID